MGSIWMLSSIELPEVPWGTVPFRDKLAHAIEYAGLGFFVARAARRCWPDRSPFRLFAVAVWIAGAWGVIDEIHQAFVPGRSADVFDVVADALGAMIGAAARLVLCGRPVRSSRTSMGSEVSSWVPRP
jgi:VanZ family protein